MEAKESSYDQVRKLVDELGGVLERMSATDIQQCYGDTDCSMLIILLSLKYDYRLIHDMIQVSKVVPMECGPWRRPLCMELLQLIRTLPSSAEEVMSAILACNVSNTGGQTAPYYDVLKKVLKKEQNVPFAGCLAPPTSICLQCHCSLQKLNNPSLVTLYTAVGPIPLKKVDLRCRSCKITYGITKYGCMELGYKYYDKVGPAAEASVWCYVDRVVMSQFTSLR